MEGEITSGKLYYQKHRDKNLEAVRDYRSRQKKFVSDWNREYYKKHRTSEKLYCARYKYVRWSPCSASDGIGQSGMIE